MREFLAAGLEPSLETVEATVYRPRGASLADADGESVDCVGLQFSAAGEVRADSVYLGQLEDDEAVRDACAREAIAGKIAVIDGPWPFRAAPELARQGAAGLVVISTAPEGIAHYTAELYPRGPDPRSPLPLPGVIVGAGARARLSSAVGPISIRHDAVYAAHQTANVVARVSGGERAHELVVVAAHYDSQLAGTGAWDNGTGLAAMLRLARAWRASPTARTVVFLASAEEEQGLSGAIEYCRRHAEETAATVAMVNFDTLRCTPGGTVDLHVDPVLAERVTGWLAQLECRPREVMDASLAPGADHHAFIDAGVPALWLWPGPEGNPHYHSPGDVTDRIDFESAAGHARRIAALCRLLAEDRTLGPERSKPARRWLDADTFTTGSTLSHG